MVLSSLKSPNHKGSLEEAATLWNDEQGKFQQILKQNNAIIITVRYEDLIANSEVELTRICDFMGLEFEDNMLHYYQSKNVQSNADRITDWNNLGKNVIRNNSRKFEKELGSIQIKTIERICQEIMTISGYEPMIDYPQVEEKIITKKVLTQGEVEIRNKRLAAVKKLVEKGQVV